MKMKMHKCNTCKVYTLKDKCPECGGKLNEIYPPKYTIEDKYWKYRRKLKEEMGLY